MFVVGREGEKKVGVGQITQRNNRESKADISAGQWIDHYIVGEGKFAVSLTFSCLIQFVKWQVS